MKNQIIIGLIILALAIVPILFLSSQVLDVDRKVLSWEILNKNKQIANIVANQIDQLLKSTFNLLEAAARYPSIEKKELKSLEPLMKTLIQKYRFFNGLYLLDSNGKIVLNVTGAPDVFSSRPSSDFYSNIIKGKLSNYVGREVFLSKSSMRPSLTMGVIIRGELYKLKAILAAQVDLTYLISQLRAYDLGSGSEIFVSDEHGKVVTHPGYDVIGGTEKFMNISQDLIDKMAAEKEGSFVYRKTGAEKFFISYVKMNKYNEFKEQMPEWTVIVKQPAHDFFMAINWLEKKKIKLIFSIFLIALGVCFLIIKKIKLGG